MFDDGYLNSSGPDKIVSLLSDYLRLDGVVEKDLFNRFNIDSNRIKNPFFDVKVKSAGKIKTIKAGTFYSNSLLIFIPAYAFTQRDRVTCLKSQKKLMKQINILTEFNSH